MAKNRIQRVSGIYTCADCGKLTRDTGHGEADCGMCANCYEIATWVNGINDGDFVLADVPEQYREQVHQQVGDPAEEGSV